MQGAAVKLVADVRTVPRSRANPQYNRDSLPPRSADCGRSQDVPRATNAFWQNDSFHNYADYAMSAAFREGLAHLRELGQGRRCAIMCAETVWWRCHRRIISDYLLAAGESLFHVLGPGQLDPAAINPAARVQPAGYLTYPAEASVS